MSTNTNELPAVEMARPLPVLSRKITIQTPGGPLALEVELHGDHLSLRRPPAGKRINYRFDQLWRIHSGEWL